MLSTGDVYEGAALFLVYETYILDGVKQREKEREREKILGIRSPVPQLQLVLNISI